MEFVLHIWWWPIPGGYRHWTGIILWSDSAKPSTWSRLPGREPMTLIFIIFGLTQMDRSNQRSLNFGMDATTQGICSQKRTPKWTAREEGRWGCGENTVGTPSYPNTYSQSNKDLTGLLGQGRTPYPKRRETSFASLIKRESHSGSAEEARKKAGLVPRTMELQPPSFTMLEVVELRGQLLQQLAKTSFAKTSFSHVGL